MTQIKNGARERARTNHWGEPSAAGRAATARGAWRLGGLLGALAYSLVCWTLLYHGGQAVIAWTKPEVRSVAAAEPLVEPGQPGPGNR